ncbi:unnamed protein product [Blepharisma stoltei]|uniref:Uncharacterized protein n=1 Tax=Blepharisma stoltei TaxID=1481888 RepID=A0AAU9IGY2_9CILI|nr:unnamed protein product [Blepharisma stoltei]
MKKLQGPIACTYLIKSPNNEIIDKVTNIYYKKSRALSLLKHIRRAVKRCHQKSITHIDMYTDDDKIFGTFDKVWKWINQLYQQRLKTNGLLSRLGMTCKWRWVLKVANAEAIKIARDEFERLVKNESDESSASSNEEEKNELEGSL